MAAKRTFPLLTARFLAGCFAVLLMARPGAAQTASATALGASPGQPAYGQQVTLTAVVTGNATPTGTVTFMENGQALPGGAQVTGNAGQYSYVPPAGSLPVGTHSYSARFSGDAQLQPSSGALALTVGLGPTTTTLAGGGASAYGQPVTFTATVTPKYPAGAPPTGNVVFLDGSSTLATVALNNGTAALTLPGPGYAPLALGGHSITASYQGDAASFQGSPASNAVAGTVAKAASTTGPVSSSAGSASVYGQPVSFTAAVSSASGTPPPDGGVVTFYDGTATLGTGVLVSGSASFTTATLAVGSAHSITAKYAGDLYNLASTAASSPALPLTVSVAPTATVTALGAGPNPSYFGQSVTFSATVSAAAPSAAVPTGTVVFMDGATALSGSVTLSNGVATFTTTALAPGTSGGLSVNLVHAISAVYSGSANFAGSSNSGAPYPQTVTPAPDSLVLAASPGAPSYGQTVTLTASGLPSSAIGTVTFMDGAATLGTGTVGAGKASFAASAASGLLAAGAHSLTATYGGDASHDPCTTQVLPLTVAPATPAITSLVAAPASPSLNQPTAFTATVTGAGAAPTGAVSFSSGGTALGSAQLAPTGAAGASSASITVPMATPGSNTITATYTGDPDYGSASKALTLTVGLDSTSVTLASSAPSQAYGTPVTLIATVTLNNQGSGALAPGGTVTFTDAYTSMGNTTTSTTLASGVTGSPSGNSATYSYTSTSTGLKAGTHLVTAKYNGDSNSAAASSSPLTQTVTQDTGSLAISDSVGGVSGVTSVAFGKTVSLVATLAVSPAGSGPATGTVTFTDAYTPPGGAATSSTLGTASLASAGTATLNLSGLLLGAHRITASYGGDNNFKTASSPALNLGVTAPTGTTLVSSLNPSSTQQAVTFTAAVGLPAGYSGAAPSGTVSFTDTSTGTVLGSAPVSGGEASLALPGLAAGTHAVSASFSSSTPGLASSTSPKLSQVVGQATAVALDPGLTGPYVYGQAVPITATVSALPAGGAFTPNGGTVTFLDGATSLGTAPLVNGSATLTTGALAVSTAAAPRSLTATYGGASAAASGSVIFLAAPASAPVTPTVNPATPTVALALAAGSLSTISFQQPVSFTATVAAPAGSAGAAPTGTVTFYANGSTSLGTASLAAGAATLATTALAGGTDTITATYNGNASYTPASSAALAETVNQDSASVTLASNHTPSSVTGQAVTFTATVAPVAPASKTPTGTVTFTVDNGAPGAPVSLSGGKASFSAALGAAGSPHTVAAAYSGDGNFSPAAGTLFQSVDPGATATVLAPSPNPSVSGQPVTFSATVTAVAPAAGTPAGGQVTFYAGANALGTATLAGGKASLATPAVPPGSNTITAAYGGDPGFAPSPASAGIVQTVVLGNSTVALAGSPSPAPYNAPLTLTATVTAAAPATGTPTGTVTFLDGGTPLGGPAPLAGGVASFSPAQPLAPGSHQLTAAYSGDAQFNGFTTRALALTVSPDATATSLAASGPNPSGFGQPISFTATVATTTPGGAAPAGSVRFLNGGATLDTEPLVANPGSNPPSASATFTTSSLAAGSYSISAAFVATATAQASSSAALAQTVAKLIPSQTALAALPASPGYGQPVTLTATITPAPASLAGSETVTFYDNAVALGTGTLALNGGSAAASWTAGAAGNPPLAIGAHALSAAYGGDATLAGSSSSASPVALTVVPGATSTVLAVAPAAPTLGQPVTLTATVTPALPVAPAVYGPVSFTDTTTGTVLGSARLAPVPGSPTGASTASVTTSALAAGSHSLAAAYAGDIHWAGSTAPATPVLVTGPAITGFSASPATVSRGGSASFTAGFSGGTAILYQQTGQDAPVPVGSPVSGAPFPVSGIMATASYTLQVTDGVTTVTSGPVTVTMIPGVFEPAPAADGLATGRTGHTATLLADGRILIAGGTDPGGQVLDSYEIHDPAAAPGTALVTGTLSSHRTGHTATLLASGAVLLAGGTDENGNVLGSAELVAAGSGGQGGGLGGLPPGGSSGSAPGSGGSAPGGGSAVVTLSAPRTGHTATLLWDGTVLLAGGTTDAAGDLLASAEIVDPAQLSSTPVTGPMNAYRTGHVAALQPDGTVLLAGGLGRPNLLRGSAGPAAALTSAEVFVPGFLVQPATKSAGGSQHTGEVGLGGSSSFTAVGDLVAARTGAAAVVVPATSRTLVLGGGDPASGPSLLVESFTPGVLDPQNGYLGGQFAPFASLQTGRFRPQATAAFDGRILVTGGADADAGGNPIAPALSGEAYDPAAGGPGFLTLAAAAGQARLGHTATLRPQDGLVFLAGGIADPTAATRTELLDPQYPSGFALPPAPDATLDGVPVQATQNVSQSWTIELDNPANPPASAPLQTPANGWTLVWKPLNADAAGPLGQPSFSYSYPPAAGAQPAPSISVQVLVVSPYGIPAHGAGSTALVPAPAAPVIQVLDTVNPADPDNPYQNGGNATVGASFTASVSNPDPRLLYTWAVSNGSPLSGSGTSFGFSTGSLAPGQTQTVLTCTGSDGSGNVYPASFTLNLQAAGDLPVIAAWSVQESNPVPVASPVDFSWQVSSQAALTALSLNVIDPVSLAVLGSTPLPVDGTAYEVPGLFADTTYQLQATNPNGTATSPPLTVTVDASPGTPQIRNFSVRANPASPGEFDAQAIMFDATGFLPGTLAMTPPGPVLTTGGLPDSFLPDATLKAFQTSSPQVLGTAGFTLAVTGQGGTATATAIAEVAAPTGAAALATSVLQGPAAVNGARVHHTVTELQAVADRDGNRADPWVFLAGGGLFDLARPNFLSQADPGLASFTSSTDIYDPANDAISAGPAMQAPRAAHSATRLPDGTVLLAGGLTIGTAPDGTPAVVPLAMPAELYDPGQGTLTPVGSLHTPRFGHSATLLPSSQAHPAGAVLIAGGQDGNLNPLGAEVYDIAAQSFALPAVDLAAPRYGHTATALPLPGGTGPYPGFPDGAVLVTGGTGLQGVLASAELFDPDLTRPGDSRVGGFVPVLGNPAQPGSGSLTQPRSGHSAVALAGGRLLLADLQRLNAILDPSEIFDPGGDPSQGSFTPSGILAQARSHAFGFPLSIGKALVAGGDDAATGAESDRVELFDPATGCFTSAARLQVPTDSASAAAALLNDGRVLFSGGLDGDGNASPAIQFYDPLALASPLLTGPGVLLVGNRQDPGYVVTAVPSLDGVNPAGSYPANSSSDLFHWSISSTNADGSPAGTPGGFPFLDEHQGFFLLQTLTTAAPQAAFIPGDGATSTIQCYVTRFGHTSSTFTLPLAAGPAIPLVSIAAMHPETAGVPFDLTWTVADATSATLTLTQAASPVDIVVSSTDLTQDPSGSQSITLNSPGSYTFSLVAVNATGSASASATVDVAPGSGSGQPSLSGFSASYVGAGMFNLSATETNADGSAGIGTVTVLAPGQPPAGSTHLRLPSGASVPWGPFPGTVQFLLTLDDTPDGTATLTTIGEVPDAVAGSVAADGTWTVPAYHSATLLIQQGPSGSPANRVFFAGGGGAPSAATDPSTFSSYTGTYDPVQDVLTPGTPLASALSGHTATQLQDGTILLAGGLTLGPSGIALAASPQVYDPAAGTVTTLAGTLAAPRFGHTATLLDSGKVLLAGGTDLAGNLLAAELYDPATGTCSTTRGGSMLYLRTGHSATLLLDGTVLLAGGTGVQAGATPVPAAAPLANGEIYDPDQDRFFGPFPMNEARTGHAAILLPAVQQSYNPAGPLPGASQVLLAGVPAGAAQDQAELFQSDGLDTGHFSAVGILAQAAANPFGAPLFYTGQALVAGGLSGGTDLAIEEIYAPGLGLFGTDAPLPVAMDSACATATPLLDGRVLFAGGSLQFLDPLANLTPVLQGPGEPIYPGLASPSYQVSAYTPGGTYPLDGSTTFTWNITGGTFPGGGSTATTTQPFVTFIPGAGPTVSLTCATTRFGVTSPASAALVMPLAAGDFSSAPASVSYTLPPAFPPNVTVTPLLPATTGGTPTSYSVDLPAQLAGLGLTLDPLSGAISGLPAQPSGPASFTITASNSVGSAQTQVTLAVAAPPLTPVVTLDGYGSYITAGRQGLTASIPPQGDASLGVHYSWALSQGSSITSAPDSPSITYTAGPEGPFQAQATVTNPAGAATGSTQGVTAVPAPDLELLAPLSAHPGDSWLRASIPAQPGLDGIDWVIGGVEGDAGADPVSFTAGTSAFGVQVNATNLAQDVFSANRSVQVQTGTWLVENGGLPQALASGSVTKLPGGRVLVAGGYDGMGYPLAAASIYDPVSGVWFATGPLQVPRYGHTATLLGDGRVLAVGGATLDGNLNTITVNSCEIYDPATGAWTATATGTPASHAPLDVSRYNHTATLLNDGTVLVAGGTSVFYNPDQSLGSLSVWDTEIYDPGADAWTPTAGFNLEHHPGLNQERASHTATLLANGQILVAGGVDTIGNPLASSETYDPATQTWTTTANPMNLARQSHTATLLNDGTVLVAGGIGASVSALDSAERFDPSKTPPTWTPTLHTLGKGRSGHTASLLDDGEVLVAGGFDDQGNALASAERFAPAAGVQTWTPTQGSLAMGRGGHGAASLPSGKVLVVAGGSSLSDCLASAETYDPAADAWSPTRAGLGLGRAFQTEVQLGDGGPVLAAGGRDADGAILASAQIYDPVHRTWTDTGALNTARQNQAGVFIPPDTGASPQHPQGTVLVAGGLAPALGGGAIQTGSFEIYDPASHSWTAPAPTVDSDSVSHPIPRSDMTAVTILPCTDLPFGQVLVMGGLGTFSGIATAETYDPGTQAWTVTANQPTYRSYGTATYLPPDTGFPDGSVLFAGGLDGGNAPLATVERYDPRTRTWSPDTAMTTARAFHTATWIKPGTVLQQPNAQAVTLSKGAVLVAGGDPGNVQPDSNHPNAELYDLNTQSWIPLSLMIRGQRSGHVAIRLPVSTAHAGGAVLLAGGDTDELTTEIFDFASGTWSPSGPLTAPAYRTTASRLGDGSVMIGFGQFADDITQIYVPAP